MKKIFYYALSIMLCALLFVGCGSVVKNVKNVDKAKKIFEVVTNLPDAAKLGAAVLVTDIEPEFSLGKFQLGMNYFDIAQNLGSGEELGDNWLRYGDYMLRFSIIDNNAYVDCVACTQSGVGTKRGIYVGSTTTQIEEAYGKNYVYNDTEDGTAFFMNYVLDGVNLSFLISKDTGRVQAITLSL